MGVAAESFKQALSRWASGITIVTCRTADRPIHGMTASSLASASLDPPLVLVCVNRNALTHALIAEQGAFGINILRSDQQEVSSRCAGFLGAKAHFLDDQPYRTGESGAPLLEDALSWLECTLWRSYDAGDHTIYVGEVQSAGATEGEPLLWYQRGYRELMLK